MEFQNAAKIHYNIYSCTECHLHRLLEKGYLNLLQSLLYSYQGG